MSHGSGASAPTQVGHARPTSSSCGVHQPIGDQRNEHGVLIFALKIRMMLFSNRPEFPEIDRKIPRSRTSHSDSMSELVVEVAVKVVFSVAKISFRETKRGAHFRLCPDPGLHRPYEFMSAPLVGAKLTEDNGMTRDKVPLGAAPSHAAVSGRQGPLGDYVLRRARFQGWPSWKHVPSSARTGRPCIHTDHKLPSHRPHEHPGVPGPMARRAMTISVETSMETACHV